MLFFVSLAWAHIGIECPPARYPSNGFANNKDCPCGVGTGGTTCTGDRSDPDRSTRVTEYAPGETITVAWHEVVGHSGRFRIAFDDDGADLDDFNANILLDIEDPPGQAGNTGLGDLWEVEVTLPSTPCDNCTLQLIQVMNGNTAVPVSDPTGMSTYYQCADITLALPDTGGSTADTSTVAVPTADTSPVAVPTADTSTVAVPTADTSTVAVPTADTSTVAVPTADTSTVAVPTADTGTLPTGPTTPTTPGTTPPTTPGTTPPTASDTPPDAVAPDADEARSCGCQAGVPVGGLWPVLVVGLVGRRRRTR